MFAPCPTLPAAGRLLWYRPHRSAPTDDVRALGMEATTDTVELVVAVGGDVRPTPHAVAAVPVGQALDALLRLGGDAAVAGRRLSTTTRVYVRAAQLAVVVAAGQHVAPVLRAHGDDVIAGWRALLPPGGAAADALTALSDTLPAAGYALLCDDAAVWHPHALLRAFVDACVDCLARPQRPTDERPPRPRARLLPWTSRWVEAATDPIDATVPLGAERGEMLAGVSEWFRPFDQPPGAFTPTLVLHAPDRRDGDWRLAFGVRRADGTTASADSIWRHDADDGVEALLEGLARAGRVFPPIETALDQLQPTGVDVDATLAWRFVEQVAPLLRGAGFVIAMPETLYTLRPRLQLGLEDGDDVEVTAADASVADASAADEVAVTWQATIGDTVVDAPTVDRLMAALEPLVYFDGSWVRIADEVRADWRGRQAELTSVPLVEALGLAVTGVATGLGRVGGSAATHVTAVGPLATLVDRLRRGGDDRLTAPPDGFVGELRTYQLDAVAWLDMMAGLGLGGVLADDMGLGKTVMLIAHLLSQGDGPHLVVCPTSVVANWERELERFAPGLQRHRHHGPDRRTSLAGVSGVVVTSYGTLRRDIAVLAAVDWRVVTLDEAQQVKNPDTLGARAVRRLRSGHCVALTGTPVENRLKELWSVVDYTNPGLLGSRGRFDRRFARPIERRGDPDVRRQLRRLIAPFVLRRTKSDPRVAPDLPPKIERSVPCVLTDSQRQQYETAVESFRRQAATERSAMQHRGQVLALLTRLKQICDHPTLVDRGDRRLGRSGKLAVAVQLIDEAIRADEQVLVFTQFVTMAEVLRSELTAHLGVDVPVLHGGQSTGTRQRLVDRFQGLGDREPPPVLVASLRAGGIGLNLTAATQVVHYDRWWNPAVEDQASDRTHRIGQTSRVLVHRLVTVGTLEERIDEMLDRKRAMAEAVVGAGETWLTELEPEELLAVVELGTQRDAELVGRR